MALQSLQPLQSIPKAPLNPALSMPGTTGTRTSTVGLPKMPTTKPTAPMPMAPMSMKPVFQSIPKSLPKTTAALSPASSDAQKTDLPNLSSLGSSPKVNADVTNPTGAATPAAYSDAGTPPTQSSANPFVNPMDKLNERLSALQEANLAYLKPTDAENALQAQQDAINAKIAGVTASRDLGLAQTANQPIAMNFITGQQKNLQEQAAAQTGALSAQAVPLQQQLAREQANRALAGQIAGLKQTNLQSQVTDLNTKMAPKEVNGTLVAYNPATGKYEAQFTAPSTKAADGFTLDAGQARYDSTGKLIASGPQKQLTQDEITKQQNAANAKSAASKMSVDASNLIDELKNSPDLSSATGVNSALPTLPGTQKANIEAKIEQLKSLLALPQLQYLKGLGAMSDREFGTIQASIGALKNNMTDDAFKKELVKIQNSLRATYQQNQASSDTSSSTGNSQYSW